MRKILLPILGTAVIIILIFAVTGCETMEPSYAPEPEPAVPLQQPDQPLPEPVPEPEPEEEQQALEEPEAEPELEEPAPEPEELAEEPAEEPEKAPVEETAEKIEPELAEAAPEPEELAEKPAEKPEEKQLAEKPETKIEPKTEVEPEAEPAPALEPVPEFKPEAEKAAEEPVKEPQPAEEPEPKTQAEPEPAPEAEPEVKPEPAPEAEPEVKPEPEPAAEFAEQPEPEKEPVEQPEAAVTEPAKQPEPAGPVVMMPFIDNISVEAKQKLSGPVKGELTVENSPYLVTEDITIASGTALTIKPGVIIRFAPDAGLIIKGTLISQGMPDDEVVLTGENKADPGSWSGLIFEGGTGKLEHTRILYAGQDRQFNGRKRNAAVYIFGDADPAFSRCQIAGTKGDAVHLFDASHPEIMKSDISGGAYPFIIHSPLAELAENADNRYTDITNYGISLFYRNVDRGADVVLKPYDDLPYITGNLQIRKDSSMHLEAGTILKLHEGFGIEVRGTLQAKGTPENPVIITSGRDDIGGDTNGDGEETKGESGHWKGIAVLENGEAEFASARIRYAGQNSFLAGKWYTAAFIADGSASIRIADSEIADIRGDGFAIMNDAAVFLRNVSLENIFGKGIVNSGTADADARQVWWDDPSGPKHESNPNGSGLEVSDGVQFTPFLHTEPQFSSSRQ